MNLELTPAIIAGFRDKDSKVDRYRQLYEKHPFLEAYSLHTELRMKADPKWAIGRGDEWESHGLLQREFLMAQGLEPSHTLLDVGCGPGRAARRLVPYLDAGKYVGIDISDACLVHAQDLSVIEFWAEQDPIFIVNADLNFDGFDLGGRLPFDFVWAHSVFTHLPPQQIVLMIANVPRILRPGGRFIFTYKRSDVPQRSGLKQFQYPIEFFMDCAGSAGMRCEPLGFIWPAHQRTVALTKRIT